MQKAIIKPIKDLFKPFEEFQKAVVKEGYYFLLGIAMDVGKGMGWKGNLFVWPFLAAFVLAAILVLRPVIVFIWQFIW